MIILKNLSAEAAESNWVEPRGTVQSVSDEPVPGFFRSATLGAAGLVLKRGNIYVGLPLDELFKLAGEASPAFIPPTESPKPQG